MNDMIAPGSRVKVLVDYRPVREDEVAVAKGESVLVVASDPMRGYRVRRDDDNAGWLPAYVLMLLSSNPRKPAWTFRKLRKPSFSSSKSSSKSALPPLTVQSYSQVTATARCGETAVLKCAKAPGVLANVHWRRGDVILHSSSSKYSLEHDDHLGVAALYINGCGREDAGDYECVQVTQEASVATVIQLYVRGEEDKRKVFLCAPFP